MMCSLMLCVVMLIVVVPKFVLNLNCFLTKSIIFQLKSLPSQADDIKFIKTISLRIQRWVFRTSKLHLTRATSPNHFELNISGYY
jgi:hypothetical protein